MPYTDHDDVRKLCDVLEEILTHVLAGEPTWTDWLDGLIDYDTERLPHQRGRVRLRFMDCKGCLAPEREPFPNASALVV
jgi:hypothetical protein